MDFIKKYWPMVFKIEEKDVKSFVTQLIIFIVICGVLGFLISILSGIPILGIIFSIIGALLELYGFIGIILCVLKFLGLAK